jgi:hypothetical protein
MNDLYYKGFRCEIEHIDGDSFVGKFMDDDSRLLASDVGIKGIEIAFREVVDEYITKRYIELGIIPF